jgi:RND family efflux transporter MFP subunit
MTVPSRKKEDSPTFDGLARLAIDHDKRPTGQRGWGPFMTVVVIVVAVTVIGAVWYYNSTGQHMLAVLSDDPVDVELYEIPRTSETPSRSVALVASGRIVSDVQIKIATKVSGQIVELNVEQGDVVEAGQVLARVEDVLYRAQRDEAEAQHDRSKHDLERARSELSRTSGRVGEVAANHAFEKRNYERLVPLHAKGQVGEFELHSALNRYEAAAAAVEQAHAQVESAQAAVQVREAEVRAAAAVVVQRQKRLDDCDIKSPISGVVLERNAQVGDFLAAEGGRGANANAQLVEVADMSRMRLEIDVGERDIHRVSKAQQVRITPDAHAALRLDGKVMWVDPVGDYARATVQVKVRILDPAPGIRVGGSAKAEFLTAEVESTSSKSIWLPREAVKPDLEGNSGVVFTVIDEHAVENRVTIGARTTDATEILSGVYGGMFVVRRNLEDLEDGAAVYLRGIDSRP